MTQLPKSESLTSDQVVVLQQIANHFADHKHRTMLDRMHTNASEKHIVVQEVLLLHRIAEAIVRVSEVYKEPKLSLL